MKPNQYFEKLYQDSVKVQGASKAIDSTTLSSMLGDFKEETPSMAPELIHSVTLPDYRRERYMFHFSSHLSAPVYVLTPENGAACHPAVLALHGHGDGSREIVGVDENGEEDHDKAGIHQHFAASLAKCGFKVFAPEMMGIGERRLEEDKNRNKPNSCYMMAVRLLAAGKTLAGLRVFEARRTINEIASFSDVESSRIGTMGFSGGGQIAAYTSILDERIQAAVLSGFANTFADSVLAMEHCIDNYIPGMSANAELPAYLALIAPRPLFIEAGRADPLFPVKGTEKAVAELRLTYERFGALHQFDSDLFEGKHEINGRYAYQWLKNKL